MIKRLKIILSLFTLFTFWCYSQLPSGGDELLRETIRKYGQVRITIPFPGSKQVNELSQNVSVSSLRNKTVEVVLSPLTVDWFISQNFKYTVLEAPDAKSIITASDIKQAMEWESYPSYTQYDSIMQSFAGLYPGLCNLDTIGTSIYGKLILVLKISDNAGVDEDEPETFYTSSMHGDETGGFILMLRLADYLLKNYNTDSRIKNLVDNLEIWINPLANPDGTYRTGNTISSPTRDNANGYDLNRNFPDPELPGMSIQKENQDMVKFMRGHKFILSANFHSGAEVVNYPWDSRPWYHADDDWFYRISRKYADTVHVNSVPGYMTFLENGVTNGYDWYSINGGRQDFVTWELQGREVTIELDDAYITPVSQLGSLWQYNWRSLLGYLENSLYGIHGLVTDAKTGDPVVARVFIEGHDKDSSQVYSDKITGRFVRLLAAGKWDLEFTADGYVDNHVKGVIVTEGKATELDVEMVKFINPVDTTDTPVPVLYPNPANDILYVVLPKTLFGTVNVRVYNIKGIKFMDYVEQTEEDIPLHIDIKNLPGGVYVLTIRNSITKITEKCRFVVVRR